MFNCQFAKFSCVSCQHEWTSTEHVLGERQCPTCKTVNTPLKCSELENVYIFVLQCNGCGSTTKRYMIPQEMQCSHEMDSFLLMKKTKCIRCPRQKPKQSHDTNIKVKDYDTHLLAHKLSICDKCNISTCKFELKIGRNDIPFCYDSCHVCNNILVLKIIKRIY
jgi:hypothetical protein